MKRISFALAAIVAVICLDARSEIFKCTTPEGDVIYSSTACPDGVGDVAVQRGGPPPLGRKGETLDFPHQLNLNATRILQIPYKAKLTVIESELARRNQSIRPPAPRVPSVCTRSRYESDCFDPSGGESTAQERARIITTYGHFRPENDPVVP